MQQHIKFDNSDNEEKDSKPKKAKESKSEQTHKEEKSTKRSVVIWLNVIHSILLFSSIVALITSIDIHSLSFLFLFNCREEKGNNAKDDQTKSKDDNNNNYKKDLVMTHRGIDCLPIHSIVYKTRSKLLT